MPGIGTSNLKPSAPPLLQGVNVRDVLNKLVDQIDPAKARDNFGPGFYYGPKQPPGPMMLQNNNR